VALLLGCFLTGCAAMTNPVGDAIPVRKLPNEYLATPKDEEIPVPLSYLRQKPQDVYRLDAGDVLGVYVESVLGDRTVPPPVRLAEQGNQTPAFGYPIPVAENGTVSLPLIPPVTVRGKTVSEAQEAIRKAYTEDIIKPGRERIIVTLLQPRVTRVLVVREDFGGFANAAAGVFNTVRRGNGATVDLPAYENDVLNALSRTGGLPGLEARNEVLIQRGSFDNPDPTWAMNPGQSCRTGRAPGLSTKPEDLVVRIPLRLKPGEQLPFDADDVILHKGDIVFVAARDTEVFYVGGLMVPKQLPLPRDYDLHIVDAIALGGGPLVNGGVNQNNLSGAIVASGLGSPSPSSVTVLRKTKNRGQLPIHVDLNRALRDQRENIIVQAGDVLILQETPGEAFTRWFTTVIRWNFIGTIIRQRDLIATVNGNLP
jgi:protein involved in polysaccharide export with SLBB domain